MQDRLLDILILGLLVLLFAVIYRKRRTLRLQFWITGWLFVLAHFAVLLPSPATEFGQKMQEALGMAGLWLGGTCFALASSAFALQKKNRTLLAIGVGVFPLIYIFIAAFYPAAGKLQAVSAIVAEAVYLGLSWHFRRGTGAVFWTNTFGGLICGIWLLMMIGTGRGELGIYALLTQIFLSNAVLFLDDFKRLSIGVITTFSGLLAWAAIFPIALGLGHFLPTLHVPAELWNVPKYFVEFGMILTLMENQIYSARWQGEQYRLLFDGNPYPMFIYDAKSLVILRVNDAALDQYAYSREEFLKMTVAKLYDLAALTGMERMLGDIHNANTVRVTGPWLQRRKNGTEFQVELSSQPIEFEGRDARLCMAQDVTDRQRLHEQLVHRAHHDSLTGLPNRFLLEQRMKLTLENASRYSHKAAILCMDLDRFKQINDRYGHAAGDACLQEVAERLTSRLRESDTVARTGGEEFTVVVGELLYGSDAEKIANDLLTTIRRPFSLGNIGIELSASIGVAIYPDHGTEGTQLWRASDIAMYRAKFSGGNRYMLVSEEDVEYALASREMPQMIRLEDRR